MRPINHASYVYRPWSQERRQRASDTATVRIYGSLDKGQKARLRKLRALIRRRIKLTNELGIVRTRIKQLRKFVHE